VHVQRQIGGFAESGNRVRTKGDIGDKVTIHNIAVQPISPTLLGPLRVPREIAKIAGKN
jgi:hypothetical protein